MRGNRVVVTIAVIILLVLLFAWIDGGEQPVRLIEEPVDLPERAQ